MGRLKEHLAQRLSCLPSALSLHSEQGCLRAQEAGAAHPHFGPGESMAWRPVVGEQRSNSGGSLHSLFAFGAKRNHMTFFKGNSLSASWWNFQLFSSFLSPQRKKVSTTRSKIPEAELSPNGGKG